MNCPDCGAKLRRRYTEVDARTDEPLGNALPYCMRCDVFFEPEDLKNDRH